MMQALVRDDRAMARLCRFPPLGCKTNVLVASAEVRCGGEDLRHDIAVLVFKPARPA
jgi:hypothetical protein